MKIISKFKDYYDYLIGIYGEDPLVIYNRHPYRMSKQGEKLGDGLPTPFDNEVDYIISKNYLSYRIFYICGKTYIIVKYKDKYYYTFDEQIQLLDNIDYKLRNDYFQTLKRVYKNDGYSWRKNLINENLNNEYNKKYNCPIIIDNFPYLYLNPKLSDQYFNKIMPAQELYLLITNFLSKKDENMPSDPTDMYRYEEKGFDKKTSFRKM